MVNLPLEAGYYSTIVPTEGALYISYYTGVDLEIATKPLPDGIDQDCDGFAN
jgi:hypothetical protein